MTDSDQRASFRMDFKPKVICRMDKGEPINGKLKDISISGCYLEINQPVKIEKRNKCVLTIILKGQSSRLRLDDISGQITRNEESGLAIVFDTPFEWIAAIPVFAPKVRLISATQAGNRLAHSPAVRIK